MISKKVLSEVLCIKVVKYIPHLDGEFDPCILITYKEGSLLLNIYELAHKCKEWVNKNAYILLTFETVVYIVNDTFDNAEFNFDLYKNFTANTEPEAIFKACEWILNKEKENV